MAPLSNVVTFSTQLAQAVSTSLLQPLPNGYNTTSICHVNRHSLDVLPGTFNRTVWQSPWNSSLVQDEQAKREIERIANTPFIAYDEKFLSIVGRNPKIDKIMELDQHIHEGPSYIPTTNQLFFTEWGEGETVGGFAQHPWQYWLDLGAVDEDPNNIKVNNVTLDPPIQNAHGSFYHNGSLFVATDGGNGTVPSLYELDPVTKEHKKLLNNYYGHPFDGFNDLAISPAGDIFLSDTSTAYDHGIVGNAPGNPAFTWYLNRNTGEVRPVGNTLSKGNGVTVSPDGKHLVVSDTGASGATGKDVLGPRSLTKYSLSMNGHNGGLSVTNPTTLTTPIAGLYDGLRYTGSGKLLLGASYEGLDFIDAETGAVYGTIQVQKGDSTVNFAFRQGGLIYSVGKGGVYRIKIDEECAWQSAAFGA